MSQRSIVEINHDFSYEIEAHPDVFAALITQALSSGSADDWKPLERFGFKRAVQRHHTERCRISVGADAFKREHVLL